MLSVHSLRIVASFALLGAVIAGSFTGWIEHQPVDFRVVGAILGAAFAIIDQRLHQEG